MSPMTTETVPQFLSFALKAMTGRSQYHNLFRYPMSNSQWKTENRDAVTHVCVCVCVFVQ